MGTLLTIIGLTFGLQMNDSLRLTIKEDTLFTQVSNPEIRFSTLFENVTSTDYLMYSLTLYNEGLGPDSSYCNGNQSAGNSVFLYNSNGKQQYITISLGKSIYDDPVTLDDIEAIYDENKRLLIKSRGLMSSQSSFASTVTFNLEKFHLEPGIYDLYVIYSSGNFLYDVLLGREIIKKHEKEFNACLFQGCVKSNTVKLIVE